MSIAVNRSISQTFSMLPLVNSLKVSQFIPGILRHEREGTLSKVQAEHTDDEVSASCRMQTSSLVYRVHG